MPGRSAESRLPVELMEVTNRVAIHVQGTARPIGNGGGLDPLAVLSGRHDHRAPVLRRRSRRTGSRRQRDQQGGVDEVHGGKEVSVSRLVRGKAHDPRVYFGRLGCRSCGGRRTWVACETLAFKKCAVRQLDQSADQSSAFFPTGPTSSIGLNPRHGIPPAGHCRFSPRCDGARFAIWGPSANRPPSGRRETAGRGCVRSAPPR